MQPRMLVATYSNTWVRVRVRVRARVRVRVRVRVRRSLPNTCATHVGGETAAPSAPPHLVGG